LKTTALAVTQLQSEDIMTRTALERCAMNISKLIVVCFCSTVVFAQSQGKFDLIAEYRGIGGANATGVGPGPTPGSERVYTSYTYTQNTFEVLSVDPETGNTTVFTNPVAGEWAAYGFAVGPDGDIYLGTAPTAHFVKLDPKRGTSIDVGRPAKTEEWIFDLTFGSDERLYGATYPEAKLVRYSPKTGALEDLGRLDPTEQYARYIVSSNDGFLYVGIGSGKANVAVYQIATMQHREILPLDAQTAGITKVYRAQDGKIYASTGARLFLCNHWTATEVTPDDSNKPGSEAPKLHDGRMPNLAEKNGALRLSLTNPATRGEVEHEVHYRGQKLSLFRIGFGPDNTLFGSSVLPIHFLRLDPANRSVSEIGNLGAGEVYSFLTHRDRFIMGVYAGLTALMSYQPGASFHPAPGVGNPLLFSPKGVATSWRPMAMVEGPDSAVYIGSIAPYGQLESPLLKFSPETGSAQQYPIIHDQGITSLAVWRNLLIGGSTINGGPGGHPTQTSACIFLWDPATQKKIFEMTPVPGKAMILDLIAAPSGHVYGIADDTLFEFDPKSQTILGRQSVPFSKVIYDSVGLDHTGNIWGLAKEGIFTIDTKTSKVRFAAPSPVEITGGFAMRDGKIYFIAGSSVYSYTM
jgi:hypothetical protein